MNIRLENTSDAKAFKVLYNLVFNENFTPSFVRGDDKMLELVFKVAKEGKMLSSLCKYSHLFSKEQREIIEYRCKLTNLYLKALKLISEVLNRLEARYYIFKTIKMIPYDMTDIDILVLSKRELVKISHALKRELGFKYLKLGTNSISLRTTLNGFDVDVDVQVDVHVGTVKYLPISKLRKISQNLEYYIDGIRTLRPELDLLIIAGHSVYKDMTFRLADVFHAMKCLNIIDNNFMAMLLRSFPHLKFPFSSLIKIIRIFESVIHERELDHEVGDKSILDLIFPSIVLKAIKEHRGVVYIPIACIIFAYADLIIKYPRTLHDLLDIVMIPKSRGMSVILQRFGLL